MGVIKSYVWCCDLCKYTGNAKSETEGPADWIKFTVEDTMVDRMFHEKCICSRCLREIDTIRKKQKAKGSSPGGGGGAHISA